VLTAAVLIVASEVYLRARFPRTYDPDPALAPDAMLGWDAVPAVTPLPMNDGAADAVYFLGDSFTDRKRWPAETQRLLRARGLSLDGFNFGVSGFGTTQQLLKLQQHLDVARPAAVVLLFFAWNDLRDNYPYPELSYGPQRAARPYLVLDNGAWTFTPVTMGARLQSRLLQSEVYLRVWHRLARKSDEMIVSRWPDLPSRLRWRAKVYYEQPASWHAFYDPRAANSAYVEGAYATTVEAFRRIRDIARARAAHLLVIGIDNAFTVDPETARRYLDSNPHLDPSMPLARVGQLLAAEEIAFINARPALAALRAKTGERIYDGPAGGLNLAGHLQPAADLLIGRLAADWLTQSLGDGRDENR
jgi:hypothetical protein